jgi:homogentisate 1,2-dioxygenase
MKLDYLSGFQNTHSTEAIKGALPKDQNSPQVAPLGLYAEQFSSSAFTAPRHENFRSWFYRIRPSVLHGEFKPYGNNKLFVTHQTEFKNVPHQLRWSPVKLGKKKVDFIDGLTTYCESGLPKVHAGSAVHLFHINDSMEKRFFFNADGEMLIVVQNGELLFKTEFGMISAKRSEIVVIPRGVKFQALLQSENAYGYVCENFGRPFRLPDLGPIGANGLASPRHFLAPVAAYDDSSKKVELIEKYNGTLWVTHQDHSPLDVVAWWGNTYPYKYDLKLFNTINTVSFDHPDPSIFTVLTSPSNEVGTANVDFVIFPPRWMVAENTFRPPYYHRNCMSEFMGLIYGVYDAKQDGFVPGGFSLHNTFSAHGPDLKTFETASNADLKPHKIDHTLAFMFESRYTYNTTKAAMDSSSLQKNYLDCWHGLKKNFKS